MAVSFAELEIGKGLSVEESIGDCKYTIEGPRIFQATDDRCAAPLWPSDLASPAAPFAQLNIGKGLSLERTNTSCEYKIEGPKIVQSSDDACIGGATTEESFAKLVIGQGLSVDGQGDCSYKISGPKIQQLLSNKCGGEVVEAKSFALLDIGKGLSVVEDEANCKYTIGGPKIAAKAPSEGGCGGVAVDANSFAKLTIGDGLILIEKDLDKCEYELEGCATKISQDGDCGTANINATEFTELKIGKGLELVVTNPSLSIYELTGPRIFQDWNSSECHETTISDDFSQRLGTPFAQLNIGKGLEATLVGGSSANGGCTYRIEGPKLADGFTILDRPFSRLRIGEGLTIEEFEDNPNLAWWNELAENIIPIGGAMKPLPGCDFVLKAALYTWNVKTANSTTSNSAIVSNDQTVKFVGNDSIGSSSSNLNMAPIKTAYSVEGDDEHKVTISLEIANKESFNLSDGDIPISWDVDGDEKLRLFISHKYLEECEE